MKYTCSAKHPKTLPLIQPAKCFSTHLLVIWPAAMAHLCMAAEAEKRTLLLTAMSHSLHTVGEAVYLVLW